MDKNIYRLLNLGCGDRYHGDWINVDLVPHNKDIICHNFLEGVPFEDNSIDVVYHSHVLEHFTKKEGSTFLKECLRVLKPSGIIRIAIPDLEQTARNYIKKMEGALAGSSSDVLDYDYTMLELFDQMVRNKSGGELADYLKDPNIRNKDFVASRAGDVALVLGNNGGQNNKRLKTSWFSKYLKWSSYKNKLLKIFLANEYKYYETGKFRYGGEIHQWMYDRFSLPRLLRNIGFRETKVRNALESDIKNWNNYELDSKNGRVYKPDSLFIEAHK